MYKKDIQKKILYSLHACLSGSVRNIKELGIADTSNNLGVIETTDNEFTAISLTRSAIEAAIWKTATQVVAAFELAGADISYLAKYPGWQPKIDSEILQLTLKSYRKLFNSDMKISATHGGLECGLIIDNCPTIKDAISIGALAQHLHSPNERLSISSTLKI